MNSRVRSSMFMFVAAMFFSLCSPHARAQDVDDDGVLDEVDVCCNTPPGLAVDVEGRPLGDIDKDCDTDLDDYALFQSGFSGPLVECEPEECDGIDNDCNCLVDDLGTLTCGIGECQVTIPACSNGMAMLCQAGDPEAETCDGLDNDCDGMTDEGNPDGGGLCDTGLLGDCAEGLLFCTNGALECEPVAAPEPEVCDAQDNDCDGVTDEGNPGGGGACGTGQPGVCSGGALVCQAGTLVCLPNQSPSSEVCDGLDNDCDGQTDEGNPGGGGPCSTGMPGVCNAGQLVCLSGAFQCIPNQTPSTEICDDLDNDCDGTTDEGCP